MAKRQWGESGGSFGPGADCSQGCLGFIPHRRGGGGLSAPGEAGGTVEKEEEGRWGMARVLSMTAGKWLSGGAWLTGPGSLSFSS